MRGAAEARRFTCPYHAWSYDTAGTLVGISGRNKFGDLDTDTRGLTELPCDERSGLVFVVSAPDAELDLDRWLGGYDTALDQLGLADMELLDERVLIGPNWKIAFDGYVDGYHLDILHRDTLGVDVMGNVMTWDAWGPHQRVAFARRVTPELRDIPPARLGTGEVRRVRAHRVPAHLGGRQRRPRSNGQPALPRTHIGPFAYGADPLDREGCRPPTSVRRRSSAPTSSNGS